MENTWLSINKIPQSIANTVISNAFLVINLFTSNKRGRKKGVEIL